MESKREIAKPSESEPFAKHLQRPASVISAVKADVGNGLGIVPVVGSGMSAPSGIPAGEDYHAYLFYCLSRVFVSDSESKHAEQWDPTSFKWPQYSDVPIYDDLHQAMLKWTQLQVTILATHDQHHATTSATGAHPDQARWQAIGAVSDWRAILNLLSRIKLEGTDVILKAPDERIIDSFFVNLTEGKRPNTAHMLLAHLADILRIKIILTTNFDALIESAFERLDMPVATFDVHYEAGFPDARFVRAQRSVVKINGGRYGLRADFTLDTPPDRNDIEAFVSYLSVFSTNPQSDPGGANVRRQRNLLVMGVSGRERRTIALICNALLKLEGLQVYWICHQRAERKAVADAFQRTLDEIRNHDGLPRPNVQRAMNRLVLTATPDLGLFLMSLYEDIFLCLPPPGVPFSALWPVPPPPYEIARDDPPLRPSSAGRSIRRQATRERRILRQETDLLKNRITAAKGDVLFVYGARGVPSVTSQAFFEMYGERHVIWLDLEEEFDAADFVFLALAAIARAVGMADVPPIRLNREVLNEKQEIPRILKSQLDRLVRLSTRPFIIVLNGRDHPGPPGGPSAGKSSWSDDRSLQGFGAIVRWLCRKHIKTVVLGWRNGLLDRLFKRHPLAGHVRRHKVQPILHERPMATASKLLQKGNSRAAADFHAFLLGLTLVRYPCHSSMLQARALEPERDRSTAKDVDKYLRRLRRHAAIRDDSGHCVFMHQQLQHCLRVRMRKIPLTAVMEREPQIRQGIADWYVKLYRASGDVHAAFESILHRIWCLTAILKALEDGSRSSASVHLIGTSLVEIRTTLRLIRPDVLSASRPLTLVRVFERITSDLDGIKKKLAENDKTNESGSAAFDSPWAAEELDKTHRELTAIHNEYMAEIGARAASAKAPANEVRSGLQQDLSREDATVLGPSTRIKDLTNSRRYGESEDAILKVLHGLGLELADVTGRSGDPERDCAREWGAGCHRVSQSEQRLFLAVTMLRRLQAVRLLQFEAAYRLAEELGDGEEGKRLLLQGRGLLLDARAFYRFSTEVMRYIDHVAFLQKENAFLRASTGVVLSWLGEHWEAHRRYNEAYGYLSRLYGPTQSMRFATVDMCRSATFLCQIDEIWKEVEKEEKEKSEGVDPKTLRRQGLVYDAIAGVERAAYKAGGQSVNTFWFSWLHELQLMVCARIAREGRSAYELFSRCRDRGSLGEWFRASLDSGTFVVGEDAMRLARYTKLADDFLGRTRESDIGRETRERIRVLRKATSKALDATLNRHASGMDDHVVRYARLILERPRPE